MTGTTPTNTFLMQCVSVGTQTLHCLPPHLLCSTDPVSQNLCETENNVIKQNKSHYSRNTQLNNYFWYTPSTTNNWRSTDHCSMTTKWHESSHPSSSMVPLSLRLTYKKQQSKLLINLATPRILALKKRYRVIKEYWKNCCNKRRWVM
jgi:hypothetical protein